MSHVTDSRFRSLIGFEATNAIFMLDTKSVTIACNPIATSLMGFTKSEIVGRPFRLICAKDDIPALDKCLASAVHRTVHARLALKPKHGLEFSAQIKVHRIVSDDKRCLVGLGVIVSANSETLSTKGARGAMAQIYEMAAVSQLTAAVTHEFNNMLVVVMNNLDLLANSLNGANQVAMIDACKRVTTRAACLSAEMNELAANRSLPPARYDINKAIKSCSTLLQKACGEAIRLKISLTASATPAVINLAQFKMALLNLVTNARDAARLFGEVVISVMVGPGSHPTEDVEYIIIEVSDHGVGMSSATKRLSTDPFFFHKAETSWRWSCPSARLCSFRPWDDAYHDPTIRRDQCDALSPARRL